MKNEMRENKLPGILFITSYPPKECGIATYSQDLVRALHNKFDHSFHISICAVEQDPENHSYTDEIKYILRTEEPGAFTDLANAINDNTEISMVMIQHEFGFFEKKETEFIQFLYALIAPIIIVFHTVLPRPDDSKRTAVGKISGIAESIIVMTNSSAELLVRDYGVPREKITVIPHGTHLVPHADKESLKIKYHVSGKKILSTFGLLGSGKSIETTLDALPDIIKIFPDTLFLVIGKTHPSVVKQEGEKYRKMLETKVDTLELQSHVRFINSFLPLPELLEYLQLTDIYLFTSRDPNQAVSGTFSYATGCGCPIISTPIPHAKEVLQNDAGIIVDFEDSKQLTKAVISLLNDENLRNNLSSNSLHRMASTAWENAAIAHALLFEKKGKGLFSLQYAVPGINLDHVKKMTTSFGMIQFSKINQPDIDSGYTLDDNARALIAFCQHFKMTRDETDIAYMKIYLDFINFCLQPDGYFINYVNEQQLPAEQNNSTNLEDAKGRAIWALGYFISMSDLLPEKILYLVKEAELTLQNALQHVNRMHSTRAMSFIIKGLYYSTTKNESLQHISLIKMLSNRLVQMYRHEAGKEWQWFEIYLTYANSILPEALLCAWLATGDPVYREIAKSSFDFLLSKTFGRKSIQVISNKNWLHKGREPLPAESMVTRMGGQQPIDVAYTILALSKFYDVFKEEGYKHKMETSLNWFLGNNHLEQIIYNPCTGGCYDGLEENNVNLNQGAESTVSYLMARLTVEKHFRYKHNMEPTASVSVAPNSSSFRLKTTILRSSVSAHSAGENLSEQNLTFKL
ncbi:MAG TPA: glycosyltransferase [Chitinophagaceae bacterium]|nr:glycosyltransferase [Chitinophagaceae bacterium]